MWKKITGLLILFLLVIFVSNLGYTSASYQELYDDCIRKLYAPYSSNEQKTQFRKFMTDALSGLEQGLKSQYVPASQKSEMQVMRNAYKAALNASPSEYNKLEEREQLEQNLKREDEEKKRLEAQKAANADKFTVVTTNGNTYNGAIINGKYYFYIPQDTIKIVGDGCFYSQNRRTYVSSKTAINDTANGACNGPNTTWVDDVEFANMCATDKVRNLGAVAGVLFPSKNKEQITYSLGCIKTPMSEAPGKAPIQKTATSAENAAFGKLGYTAAKMTNYMTPKCKMPYSLICRIDTVTKFEYDNQQQKKIIRVEVKPIQ